MADFVGLIRSSKKMERLGEFRAQWVGDIGNWLLLLAFVAGVLATPRLATATLFPVADDSDSIAGLGGQLGIMLR